MSENKKVVLLINPSREYTRGLLAGIAKYARLYSSWTFFRPLEYREPKYSRRLIPALENLHPDGILMREPPQINQIIKMGVPLVSFPYTQRVISNVANVVTDHIAVGKMAADHLLERGFRQFAYCGFDDWWWSQERREGFSRAIEHAGFQVHCFQQSRVKSQRTWSKEILMIANWLKGLSGPMGVMASNDDRAEMVVEACKMTGLNVPDEVAVVGVDNDRMICDLNTPPLSSVVLSLHKAGFDAAALLDQMMEEGSGATQTICVQPTHVASRQSTDVLAVDDPEVSAAVRYIRRHARTNIGVDDVVAHCDVSRRVLERRFRSTLGHTIHKEIRRVKVELITTLLVETQLSVSEISHQLDFPDVAHFSRYFRKAAGLSPLEYRKRFACR